MSADVNLKSFMKIVFKDMAGLRLSPSFQKCLWFFCSFINSSSIGEFVFELEKQERHRVSRAPHRAEC